MEKTSAVEAEELRQQVEEECAEMAQNAQARAENQARAAQQQSQQNAVAMLLATQALNGVAQQQA